MPDIRIRRGDPTLIFVSIMVLVSVLVFVFIPVIHQRWCAQS